MLKPHAEIDRYFEGQLPPRRRAALGQLLQRSPPAAQHYRSRLRAERALLAELCGDAAFTPAGASVLEVERDLDRLLAALAPKPRPSRRWWLFAVPAVVGALLLLVVPLGERTSSKGNGRHAALSQVDVQFACRSGGTPGDTIADRVCTAGEGLSVWVRNEAEASLYATLLVVDAAGELHVAVHDQGLGAGSEGELSAVPAALMQTLPPGMVTAHLLISAAPIAVDVYRRVHGAEALPVGIRRFWTRLEVRRGGD